MKKLISLALIVLLLVGCSSGANTATPDGVAKEFLNSLKNGNIERFNELTVPDERMSAEELKEATGDLISVEGEKGKEMLGHVFRSEFNVGAAEVDGDTAKVNVKWTGVDLSKLLGPIMAEVMTKAFDPTFQELSETEQQAQMEEAMSKIMADGESKEYEAPLSLKKVEDKWYVESLNGNNKGFFEVMVPNMPGLTPSQEPTDQP